MDKQLLKLNLPQRADMTFDGRERWPDSLDNPEYYDGLLWRRPLAFAIDLTIISTVFFLLSIANIFTFGLLGGLIAILPPIIILVLYDTLIIGAPGSGTIGMRCFHVQVRNRLGKRPSHLQAAIGSAFFSLITPWSGGILLMFGLFNNRRRLAHDFLSGVVVINKI